MKLNTPPKFCTICKSKDICTHYEVGFDVNIDGEEYQHLDKCNDCGAERLWGEFYPSEVGKEKNVWHDEWRK